MWQSKKDSSTMNTESDNSWFKTHPLKPLIPLTLRLLYFLLIGGPLWISRAISMVCFVICMAPGWAYGLRFYFSSSVLRNIRYGANPRNYLDIYLPLEAEKNKKAPVVVFITGGIWIIGYKAWGMFVGKVLAANGILAVMPDYRNFPQGNVKHMVEDVDNSIAWVFKHIDDFGGDSSNIHIMGQSAGAHLGLLTVLLKSKFDNENKLNNHFNSNTNEMNGNQKESTLHTDYANDNELKKMDTNKSKKLKMSQEWKVSDIKLFLGVAGPYDIYGLQGYFKSHGLPMNVLNGIVGGSKNMKKFSPHRLIEEDKFFHFKDLEHFSSEGDTQFSYLPPIVLLHGTSDRCVPYQKTKELIDLMKSFNIPCSMKLYDGKSHTDSIIEDLVYEEDFNREDMMTDIVHLITQKQSWKSLPERCAGSGLHATFINPRPHTYKSKGRHNATTKRLLSFARFFNPF